MAYPFLLALLDLLDKRGFSAAFSKLFVRDLLEIPRIRQRHRLTKIWSRYEIPSKRFTFPQLRFDGKLVFGQGYGATETCSLASTTFIGQTVLDNSSCGEVMANIEMKFVDPVTGEDLPIGDQGELLIRSPTVMKGYHKNEKATKDSITEDGFFRTGDLGYYKPNVGLYITDRIKELIKVKGMQVAPAELESLLRTHPAVQDAAVIGVPHEYHGEVPKAFIIKKSGQDTTPEELQDFVAKQVAAFKKIEEVVFVNDIPKTNTGKILRKDLKKMYA